MSLIVFVPQKRKALQLFLLESGRGLEEIEDAARHIPTQRSSRQDLDRLSNGENHQGVVLLAKPLHLHRLNEWIARDIAPDAFIVILDCVEDPYNFGAIVRSAAVLFARDRSAPIGTTKITPSFGALLIDKAHKKQEVSCGHIHEFRDPYPSRHFLIPCAT